MRSQWRSLLILCPLLALGCERGAGASAAASASPSASGAPVSTALAVIVPTDVLRDYRAFLAGRDPRELQSYGGAGSRRDVVELVLLQQALARGGWREPLRFVGARTYSRMLVELASGRCGLSGTTLWSADLEGPGLRPSSALIPEGRFEAGLYTSPSNERALAARTREDLSALRAVSNRNWRPDWRVLRSLGLAELRHVQNWDSMVRTLLAGRADLVLAPFQPTEGLALRHAAGTLVPIPQVKVYLYGARGFGLAREGPAQERLAAALERGLGALRAEGRVERAYTECGFYTPQVRGWRALNPKHE